MLSKTPYTQSVTSYSFQMREELPPHMGAFYRDADKSRRAFETARAAQIVSSPPNKRAEKRADTNWRNTSFSLPDPHPSFATPRRKGCEDGGLQSLHLNDSGTPLTKDEFFKMREERHKPRPHDRVRDD